MGKAAHAKLTTLAILCIAAMMAASGCIESHSDVTYGPKGPPVGSSTLRKIEVGQTTESWVLGTLGEPSSETITSDRTKILRYEYTKKIDSDLEVFLFIDSHDKREDHTVYLFEVTDGIVTRFWKE